VVRLLALIVGLPRDSAMALSTGVWWDQSHELAATAVEIAHEQLRVALAAGGVKKGRLPKPLNIPRPGAVRPAGASARPATTPGARRRSAASVADVVGLLEATHRRVGS
jgi:hypothetical protein